MIVIKLINDKKLLLINKLWIIILLILLTGSLSSQVVYADCVYQSPIAESHGALMRSFKVMSINTFGQDVDGLIDFVTTTDASCQNRLREIGEHIRDVRKPYDIVGLQEWHTDTAATCNGVVLKNRIDDLYPVSGVNVDESHTQDHYRWAHPEAYDQNDGGLGIVSKTKFLWEKYSEDDFGSFWDEDPTETENIHQFTPRFNDTVTLPFYWKVARTAHGFLFARIFLSRNPDIAVDTYVVHLTSTGTGRNKCNLQCKRGMLEQLREGIHQRSATSGYPVLVMGDFNIGGPFDNTDPSKPCKGNDGYRDIMKNLGNPQDLWLEGNRALNREEGYTHISEGDKMRIDFMFVPSDPYLVNSPYKITHKNPRKIEHIQLSTSDHRAIIAELNIVKKPIIKFRGGIVTIQQKSSQRYLDAHEISSKDYRLVTRTKQQNKTQHWKVSPIENNIFTIQQVSNGRYVDAHEYSGKDFGVVSRPVQNNKTQKWLIKEVASGEFTMQQKSNGRYIDAHEGSDHDFEVVTRPFQKNNTQRWLIKPIPSLINHSEVIRENVEVLEKALE